MGMRNSMPGILRRITLTFAVALCVSGSFAQSPPAATNGAASQTERLDKLEQQVKSAQNSADNAWMLVSSALVLMMTGPGLALFYGGLVRKKNVLATMMQ